MHHRFAPSIFRACSVALAGLVLGIAPARADDISYIQPAALDQPRINAYLSLTPAGEPQSFEGTFNIEAYFDTGASGILLSSNTAGYLGVPQAYVGDTPVTYYDVGVAGSDSFGVSEPVTIGLAPYHPDAQIDNLETYQSVYSHVFTNVRTQIGPLANTNPDPFAEDLDVLGIPLMQGKVVVFDPKPVNSFADTMRTYVYNPGTPFRPETADSDPGIPNTSRHVRLSYGNFDRFTQVTPEGAPGPTLADNPFVGPNPVARLDPNAPPDNTPGITISYGGLSTTGSWLLDTGAAASLLSQEQAAKLGIAYKEGTFGTDSPDLVDAAGNDIPEQFTLTIGGIGGTTKVAGFFLDSLLLPTQEAASENDPNLNIRFTHAPVLVSDITVMDPKTSQTLTLDGVLGMNFLVASAHITEGAAGELPSIDALSPGAFDWVVFDQVNHTLGLEPASPPVAQDLVWSASDEQDNYWLPRDLAIFLGSTNMSDKNQELRYYNDGDNVTFDDSAPVTTVVLALDVAPGAIVVNNSANDYVFTTTPDFQAKITGTASLSKLGTGTLRIETANDYTGPTKVFQGKLVLAAHQHIGPVSIGSGAEMVMETSQHFESLDVSGKASMTPGHDKVLVVNGFTLGPDGVLDLADNDMVINYTGQSPEALIQQYVLNGITSHNARGLITSMASDASSQSGRVLAVFDNHDAHFTSLGGESLSTDWNQVLVKYTYLGDANGDGKVDPTDYAVVDGKIGLGHSWITGDLNFDGKVDPSDYAQIDGNQGAGQGGAGGPQLAVAIPVPEPTGIAVALLAAPLLLQRKRRV